MRERQGRLRFPSPAESRNARARIGGAHEAAPIRCSNNSGTGVADNCTTERRIRELAFAGAPRRNGQRRKPSTVVIAWTDLPPKIYRIVSGLRRVMACPATCFRRLACCNLQSTYRAGICRSSIRHNFSSCPAWNSTVHTSMFPPAFSARFVSLRCFCRRAFSCILL